MKVMVRRADLLQNILFSSWRHFLFLLDMQMRMSERRNQLAEKLNSIPANKTFFRYKTS
jgi:hypothetical protein